MFRLMRRWGWGALRLLLMVLGVLAALVWWQQQQLAVLALSRIDPLPEVGQLMQQQRYAEAAQYLDFFLQYDYVQNNPDALALQQQIAEQRSGWLYQAGKLADGVLFGQSDEEIGQVAGIASDFFVIGDVRDLTIQGWRWMHDEKTDPVLIALSGLGVAATAVQVGSAVVSGSTAGASAPVTAPVAGLATSAKGSIATLKLMRRTGHLPNWLGDALVDGARQMRRQGNLQGLGGLQILLDDVWTLSRVPGGARLLAGTADAADLARVARLARKHGEHTATLHRVGGSALLEGASTFERMPAATVQMAATYGQRGLRTLERTGAARFVKYTARASKVVYKGDWWRLLARWLGQLPVWALAALVLAGVLAAVSMAASVLPRRLRTRS